MNTLSKIILILILILSFVLRTWNLSTNPPEIFTDELSNYTSAKSIFETGKDLGGNLNIFFWGQVAPHPPIYGYSTYISSKVFGENAFALRIPAAIYGTLTVLLLYFLTYAFTKSRLASIFSTLTLSILPWHIHFSRVGWEPAAFLPYFLLGLLFISRYIETTNPQKPNRYIFAGFTLLGVSVYTYFGSWLYSLLFIAIITISNYSYFLKNKSVLFLGVLIYAIFLTPLFFYLNSDPLNLERAKRISVFSEGLNISSLSVFLKNYFSHFTLEFLFISGDPNLRHGNGSGVLYWWMLPFILLGFIKIFSNFNKNWANKLIVSWMIIYPLGGALTNDGVPHAMRTLIGAPILSILTAIGFKSILNFLIKRKLYTTLVLSSILLSSLIILELNRFTTNYFKTYPIISSAYWQYGHKEIFEIIKKNESKYRRVCLGNLDYWGNKELLYFYLYPTPLEVIETWDSPRCLLKESLVVIPSGNQIPPNYKIIKSIYNPENIIIYTIAH